MHYNLCPLAVYSTQKSKSTVFIDRANFYPQQGVVDFSWTTSRADEQRDKIDILQSQHVQLKTRT